MTSTLILVLAPLNPTSTCVIAGSNVFALALN